MTDISGHDSVEGSAELSGYAPLLLVLQNAHQWCIPILTI